MTLRKVPKSFRDDGGHALRAHCGHAHCARCDHAHCARCDHAHCARCDHAQHDGRDVDPYGLHVHL